MHLAAIKLDNLIASADGMATKTSVNASFDDIKKRIKTQGILEIEKKSTNVLQTVTDILASMDSYEKIVLFCILGLLLIGNFTILFYMWRNQRETYTTIQILADRINDIQIEIGPRPLSRSISMRYPATAPFQTTKH